MQVSQEESPSLIRERALDILATIGSDRRIMNSHELYSAVIMAMDCVDGLFSTPDKLKRGRDYLLTRIRDQATSFNFNLIVQGPVNRGSFNSPIGEIFCDDLMSPPHLLVNNRSLGSPSVLRGDDEIEQMKINLSRFGTSLDLSRMRTGTDQDLVDRLKKVQEKIDRINQEIAIKNASLRTLDAASESVLGKLVSDVSLETDQRVGRARRRGEANRPRGGPPRTRSPKNGNNMAMDLENEATVPPQGIRTPSGRRESPTVPEALPSSSSVGPALSSPTGEGRESATVEVEPDPRDPLDLTFVDCASMLEEKPQALIQAPKVPKVVLRKIKERSRKKRPKNLEEVPEVISGETSSTRMSAESDPSESDDGSRKQPITKGTDISADESDVEYTGTEYLDPDYTKKLRSSVKNEVKGSKVDVAKSATQEEQPKKTTTKRKKKETIRVWSSTEDGEDDETDFCPEDLKIMGATAIGAIGIDCLKTAENERKNSPNINGAVSGIMKRKIQRAADVINTLVYKVESKGDPTWLRIRNRELESEVEKMKIEEVLRNREVEDMRAIVADLKREVYELKGRLDDAEEDARARESYRITKRILKKTGNENTDDSTPSVKGIDTQLPTDSDTRRVRDDLAIEPRGVVVVAPSEDMDIEVEKPVAKPEKGKQNKNQIELINSKIKELVKAKKELKKEAESGNNSTGPENLSRNPETPLPQRVPRAKLKIISNIQTVPPKSDVKRSARDATHPPLTGKNPGTTPGNTKTNIADKTIRRPPKSAAVMITGHKENFSYADALKKARELISLERLNIEKTKIRKAANGSLLIEVLGPGGAEKALRLREELQKVLKNDARVTRPVTKGEIRLIGLHDATSQEETLSAISGYGGCMNEDIKDCEPPKDRFRLDACAGGIVEQ
ncbi:gag-pol polyprotein [Lasius niger]|uniref:Gag-pol polyprotein n=1 Tax=Lasius niger TaxID=67767 RepID=A0A0J7KRP8_LASNI|nr:gag-pol polyprotein [Lasius niger]